MGRPCVLETQQRYRDYEHTNFVRRTILKTAFSFIINKLKTKLQTGCITLCSILYVSISIYILRTLHDKVFYAQEY
ncbi:hypothetical protein HanRHA438_Chr16g0749601 [Helianthus annuus]|uniref:Uncharacterized protein n=1 Tax=Helianthus annuus TaxID=4232 RepID=A0A251RYJ8_HELAN|nr:hypothetical protein HanHA300_Chr16g0601181 [Helianthus annuus]KAJ0441774.1 hypothetical protein HanIR_Chr16g0801591 [Helianthus annuus]KAJ0459676.1 hypothetical protein HanHA89_Chr16g0651681 [Helianthus annuus]KAJ0640157.1 hypothetical protein HanLR1_Chr16g0612031 [Helianthus annuus]KAJ0644113.1 hypothetical protein HanOQP8_Chr16g0608241 [Helianthus annuus]